jgi:hypothetical protein
VIQLLLQLLFIQTAVGAALALLLFKFVIEPRKENKKGEITTTAYLCALGFVLPVVVFEPMYVIQFLDIQNAGLRILLLSLPIVNSLRCLEGKSQSCSLSQLLNLEDVYR